MRETRPRLLLNSPLFFNARFCVRKYFQMVPLRALGIAQRAFLLQAAQPRSEKGKLAGHIMQPFVIKKGSDWFKGIELTELEDDENSGCQCEVSEWGWRACKDKRKGGFMFSRTFKGTKTNRKQTPFASATTTKIKNSNEILNPPPRMVVLCLLCNAVNSLRAF